MAFPTTEIRHTTAQFPIERPDSVPGGATANGMMDRISPGFFHTIGAPLLQGREFEWNDTVRSVPVAIITRPLAEQLFPNEDAVGRQVRIANRKPQDLTVVGVVGDFSPGDPRIQGVARVYVPMTQEPAASSLPSILLRTQRDEGLLDAVRLSVAALGRHQLSALRTISYQTERLITQERLLATLASAFGFLGMLIGGLGLYALLAQSVLTRTREIGVRMAVGATQRAIVALIAREGLWLVLIGATAGIPLAAAGGMIAQTLLFEVTPFNPVAIITTSVLVVLTAAAAAAVPARLAARTDPAISLRAD
jgi:ABC-type antimicrobial peptide transport system permease subunit